MSSSFDFYVCMVQYTQLQGIMMPYNKLVLSQSYVLKDTLARAITRRRTLVVHQETNHDTSNVVRTASLIRFFHQPLCCHLCILDRFNHSNSFLEKSGKTISFISMIMKMHYVFIKKKKLEAKMIANLVRDNIPQPVASQYKKLERAIDFFFLQNHKYVCMVNFYLLM